MTIGPYRELSGKARGGRATDPPLARRRGLWRSVPLDASDFSPRRAGRGRGGGPRARGRVSPDARRRVRRQDSPARPPAHRRHAAADYVGRKDLPRGDDAVRRLAARVGRPVHARRDADSAHLSRVRQPPHRKLPAHAPAAGPVRHPGPERDHAGSGPEEERLRDRRRGPERRPRGGSRSESRLRRLRLGQVRRDRRGADDESRDPPPAVEDRAGLDLPLGPVHRPPRSVLPAARSGGEVRPELHGSLQAALRAPGPRRIGLPGRPRQGEGRFPERPAGAGRRARPSPLRSRRSTRRRSDLAPARLAAQALRRRLDDRLRRRSRREPRRARLLLRSRRLRLQRDAPSPAGHRARQTILCADTRSSTPGSRSSTLSPR